MKKVPTVHELRQKGFKVRVTHVRKFYRFDPRSGKKTEFFAAFQSSKFRKQQQKNNPQLTFDKPKGSEEEFFLCSKGGETIIEIATASHQELGKGIAICSEEDSYVKGYGVKKAVAIALRNMETNKDPYFHMRNIFLK